MASSDSAINSIPKQNSKNYGGAAVYEYKINVLLNISHIFCYLANKKTKTKLSSLTVF